MKTKMLAVGIVIGFLFLNVSPSFLWAQSNAPYKIGAIIPLTGYLSWLGEYMKKGAELKVELINQAGGVNGHPLELIIYDDQSTPENATRLAQRLISKDNVAALQGTGTTPISGAVASIANRSKIPAILQSGYTVKETDHYVFNNAHRTDFAIARPMMYFQKKGITQVALLMPIGPLGELGSSVARKYAAAYKINIIGEEKFDVKAPDVTPQLAKLRSLNPQAIMSFCTGEPAALVARNMAQMGMKMPVVVSHGNASPGFLKLVSQVPVNVIVPSGKIMVPESIADSDPVKKVVVEFAKEYQKKYGEPANYFSGQQADAVALTAEALRVVKSEDRDKIRDAIENIKNFPGCNGVYNMSPKDHHGTTMDNMILLTIKDGKWQLLD